MKNLGLTGLVLLGTAGCSMLTDPDRDLPAEVQGTIKYTGCYVDGEADENTFLEENTFLLGLEQATLTFLNNSYTDRLGTMGIEFIKVYQYLGSESCDILDELTVGSSIMSVGIYHVEDVSTFDSNHLFMLTPDGDYKRLWPR